MKLPKIKPKRIDVEKTVRLSKEIEASKPRFCCWCGKVEYTETCQSESLRKVVEKCNEYRPPR